jgi:hypothetical protein
VNDNTQYGDHVTLSTFNFTFAARAQCSTVTDYHSEFLLSWQCAWGDIRSIIDVTIISIKLNLLNGLASACVRAHAFLHWIILY